MTANQYSDFMVASHVYKAFNQRLIPNEGYNFGGNNVSYK